MRARKAATILAEASTPYTLNPRSIKASEIGTPFPHPKSRTVARSGSFWDQSATTEAPTPEWFRPRPDMKIDAIPTLSRVSYAARKLNVT
jgi:hypothetical protein